MTARTENRHTVVRLLGGTVVAASALTPSPLVLPVVLFALFGLIGAALMERVPARSVVVPSAVMLLAVFAGISVVWSSDPNATLRASVLLGAVVAASALTHSLLGRDESLDLLGTALGALLLLSLVAAVVSPGTAFTNDPYERGALQGIFIHRNLLAYVALLTFSMKVVAPMRPSHRRARVLWGCVAIGVLALTNSRTGWVLTLVPLVVFVLLRNGQHVHWLRATRAVPMVLLLGISAFFVVGRLEDVTEALDRDVTLTGRTLIWDAVETEIRKEPIHGFGWAGVWQSANDVTLEIRLRTGFDAFHAHNGYLDILLQGGVVGFALFVFVFAGIVSGMVRASRRGDERIVLWFSCLGSTLLLYDLFETNLVKPLSIAVLAFSAIAFAHTRAAQPEARSSHSEQRVQ